MLNRAILGRSLATTLLCGSLALAGPATQALAVGIVYDSTNGLITSTVNSACQTSDGYVWVAQYEGVSRYDGRDFAIYDTATIEGETVDLELVSCLASDSQNRLYIGSKQVGLLVRQNDETRFAAPDQNSNVNDIFVYDDVAYVATASGAYAYDPEDDSVSIMPSTVGHEISCITADDSGIYYVDHDGVAYHQERPVDSSQPFYSSRKVKVVRAIGGTIYLGSSFGDLVSVSGGQESVCHVADDCPINAIVESEGRVYVGTDAGSFAIENGVATEMRDVPTDATVEDMFVDYENGLWFATTKGLVKAHRYPVTNLLTEFGVEERSVNACMMYDGLLYVATDTGLVILDEKSERPVQNELTEELDGVRVRDLAVFDDTLFIATYSSEQHSVITYDGTTATDLPTTAVLGVGASDEALYNHGQVKCIMTQGNRVIVGSNYGITISSDESYKTIPVNPRPLSITPYEDHFYVCTDGDGIKVFDYDLNEVETVPGTEGLTVLRAMEFEGGILYTVGSKVYYLKDGETATVQIPNHGSVVDLVDAGASLGVYTAGGVQFIDKATLLTDQPVAVKEFDYSTGLLSGVTANGKSYRDPVTGVFYLSAGDGVYRYDPATDYDPSSRLKMVIDDLQVDGEDLDYQSGAIHLDRDVKRLTIDFDVLSYLEGTDVTVHYKLEGIDADFNELDYDKAQTIEYTNLSGGDYSLLIYATNSKGAESEVIEVPVSKTRKVYEIPAVVAAGAVAAVGGIAGVVHTRMKRKMRKMEEEAERRKEMTIDTISAITSTIDAKDGYTKGHSVRVAKLSVAMGREMRMPEEKLDELYYIGLMHDVGKIGIPDEILRKPGRLTDEEFAAIKTHPEVGHQIIEPIHSLPQLDLGVMCHHERWDGKGYPRSLKGEEIPLVGRIICCADCYDAMATKRCYKESIPDSRIVEEFERCSGSQFDPKIAAVAIRLIKDGTFHRIVMENATPER